MSRIYRWYKILSPVIELDVTSVAFDKTNNILYVGVKQRFRIWPLIPVGYAADVKLVTKLRLVHEDGKYYISEQEDLYQMTEMAKFQWLGIWRVLWVVQLLAMGICIVLAAIGAPVSWAEERWQVGSQKGEIVFDSGAEDGGFIEREKQRRRSVKEQ